MTMRIDKHQQMPGGCVCGSACCAPLSDDLAVYTPPAKYPHWIHLTVDRYGVHARFTCHALEGVAPCRQTCAVGCWNASDGQACDCPTKDTGYCLPCEWLTESDAEWYESGPSNEHRTRARSGPIVITWNGDDYEWRYA